MKKSKEDTKKTTRHRRKNSENDLLKFHLKRFEKEKQRLENQFNRQLEEEKKRFDKLKRDLEKERRKLRAASKNVASQSSRLRKEELSLNDKRRKAQVNQAQQKAATSREEKWTKTKYLNVLKAIRTEKAELLELRERIKADRRILKEERKALDRDRQLVKEQRGGVLEAFAAGMKGGKQRKSQKKRKTQGEENPDDKVFSPDTDESEDTIDETVSFFSAEERSKRKSDRHRFIVETWGAVKDRKQLGAEYLELLGEKNERLAKAWRESLEKGLWKVMEEISKNLDSLDRLIPDLKEFALQGVEASLESEDYYVIGQCMTELLSRLFQKWGAQHKEAWDWCWDIVASTLITSHELEYAKKLVDFDETEFEGDLGEEYNISELNLLDDISDFEEFSLDLEDLSEEDEILDQL